MAGGTHLISIGTSGNVNPDTDFIRVATREGTRAEVVPRNFGELLSVLLPCHKLPQAKLRYILRERHQKVSERRTMEGKARIAVIAVGESPVGLSQELEKRGIAVFAGDIASVEELVEKNQPHLIALVGIRGAMEVSTLLEDQDRTASPRVAVIAARRDLSRLWGLNRDVVISLLATEMGDKVVAGRLDALARQAAKKRGELVEAPPATSLAPRSTADAFTTVAPQAVAAIQLVKQALGQGATAVAAAVEINANFGPLGVETGVETGVEELDSATLESDRPADPEAPAPSPSLLVTRAGLGLPRPTAPRRDSGAPAGTGGLASSAAPAGSADLSQEVAAPTAQPEPATAPLNFDGENTATYSASGLILAESSAQKAARADAPTDPGEQALEAPGQAEPSVSSDSSSPVERRDSGPVIQSDELIDSLRNEETVAGPTEESKSFEVEVPAVGAKLKTVSDLDDDPDSGELTRPGTTVLGLGMRSPGVVVDKAKSKPEAPSFDATATAPGLTGLEDRFFETDDTPPSGNVVDPALVARPNASANPAGKLKSSSPSISPSHAPHRPAKKGSHALPALLLGFLAAAAAGGYYINSESGSDDSVATTKRSGTAVPTPKPPTTPVALNPSPAAPAAATETTPSASERAPAPSPEPTVSGEPSGPAPDAAPKADATAPDEKPGDATGTSAAEPQPASTSLPASDPAGSGTLSDELLVSYLREPELTTKSCQELVPNPKQGVRDPAAEGSVPWQAARKAIVRGDIAAAQTSMCEAAFINPASPALESLALLYVNQNAPTEALKWLDKADAVRPNVRDTLDLRGVALTQLGKIAAARAVWFKSLNMTELDLGRRKGAAEEDVATARQHLKQGDLPRAERRLRRAVVLDPGNSLAMATLAEVMMKKGRLDAAQGLAEHAVQAEPLMPDPYVVLAEVSKLQNNLEKAKQNLVRALEIRPDFWAAKKALKELNKAAH